MRTLPERESSAECKRSTGHARPIVKPGPFPLDTFSGRRYASRVVGFEPVVAAMSSRGSVMKWQVWVLAAIAAIALFGGQVGTAHATDPTTAIPVIAAVGDMACAPEDSHFNGGAGEASNCGEIRTSAQMEKDHTIDMLLGLGDYQYGCGDPAEYALSYTPDAGASSTTSSTPRPATTSTTRSRTRPPARRAPTRTTPARTTSTTSERRAHPATAGHYSFNVGSWHLISLNANCNNTGVGGCGATQPADAVARGRPGRQQPAVHPGVLAPAAVDGDVLEQLDVRGVVEPALRRRTPTSS